MTISKKLKPILFALLIPGLICLSAIAAKTIFEKWQDHHVDANSMFFTALEDISSWQSYRFALSSALTLNNGKEAKTVLRGDCDKEGNLHIFGEIMDTEMEAYQFGNDHYRFLSASKKWKLLTESPLTENGILRMVIEPKLNFDFSDTISVTYEGTIKEEGKKFYRFTVIPKEGFHVADTYFTDFQYRVDIDAETKQITNTVIRAVSRTASENKLICAIRFFDINEDFTLQPPQ